MIKQGLELLKKYGAKDLFFVKSDNEVLDGQVAITEICTLENPEQKDIFFNFDTKTFYI